MAGKSVIERASLQHTCTHGTDHRAVDVARLRAARCPISIHHRGQILTRQSDRGILPPTRHPDCWIEPPSFSSRCCYSRLFARARCLFEGALRKSGQGNPKLLETRYSKSSQTFLVDRLEQMQAICSSSCTGFDHPAKEKAVHWGVYGYELLGWLPACPSASCIV